MCLTKTSPEPPAEPTGEPAGAGWDPLTAPLEQLLDAGPARGRHEAPAPPAPTWPCGSCASANPLEAAVCGVCGAAFLEAVTRTEPPLLVLPLLGDLSRMTKLHWFGLGAALLLLAVVLSVLLGALLG
jgi:hypothetical protein